MSVQTIEYRGHKVNVNLYSGSVKFSVDLGTGEPFVFARLEKLQSWIDAFEQNKALAVPELGKKKKAL